jgi:hypothetical protein
MMDETCVERRLGSAPSRSANESSLPAYQAKYRGARQRARLERDSFEI